MPPNASLGTTQIYVNGRHLHVHDLSCFQKMGFFPSPGRWWLDNDGTFGREGYAAQGMLELCRGRPGNKRPREEAEQSIGARGVKYKPLYPSLT